MCLVLAACAAPSANRAPSIPATRHQIDSAIAGDPQLARVTPDFEYESAVPGSHPMNRAAAAAVLAPPRKIAAMGRVTADRAVVYTHAGAAHLEETWVHGPDGWTLGHVKQLGPDNGVSAAR